MSENQTAPQGARAEQQEAVRTAYLQGYADLTQVVYETWEDAPFWIASEILGGLASNLYRYRRPVGQGFNAWAKAWVRRQTKRHKYLTENLRDSSRLLYAMFERGLYESPAKDFATEPCDLEAELYLFLWSNPQKLDELIAEGTAKDSTRLCEKAKWRTRAFRNKLNDRSTRVGQYVDEGCDFDTLRPSTPSDEVDGELEPFATPRQRKAVTKALKALTKPERKVLKMAHCQHLSPQAIARRTGDSIEAIADRVEQGTDKLRIILSWSEEIHPLMAA